MKTVPLGISNPLEVFLQEDHQGLRSVVVAAADVGNEVAHAVAVVLLLRGEVVVQLARALAADLGPCGRPGVRKRSAPCSEMPVLLLTLSIVTASTGASRASWIHTPAAARAAMRYGIARGNG